MSNQTRKNLHYSILLDRMMKVFSFTDVSVFGREYLLFF